MRKLECKICQFKSKASGFRELTRHLEDSHQLTPGSNANLVSSYFLVISTNKLILIFRMSGKIKLEGIVLIMMMFFCQHSKRNNLFCSLFVFSGGESEFRLLELSQFCSGLIDALGPAFQSRLSHLSRIGKGSFVRSFNYFKINFLVGLTNLSNL